MTPIEIKWLIDDLVRTEKSNDEIVAALQERGASYEDLVAYIVVIAD